MKVKTPESGERWGLLGGAFDPIHLGHVNLAKEIQIILNLDGILFIPSYSHPLKNEMISTSFEHRVNMLKIVCDKYTKFSISTVEKKLTGFTIDTVKYLKDLYPQTKFIFIVGTDSISQLSRWRSPEEIIDEVEVVAGKRPGYSLERDDCFSDKIRYIEINEIDISSTELRQMISTDVNDNKLTKYIDKDVIEYIKSNKLYK